jgi:hypothetical protein
MIWPGAACALMLCAGPAPAQSVEEKGHAAEARGAQERAQLFLRAAERRAAGGGSWLLVRWRGARAAADASDTPSAATSATPAPPGIADNSFLLEEAYNQERGVVQHIQAYTRNWETGEWSYSFTQEWPVNPAPRHQLSYTLTALSSSMAGEGGGIGDVYLNWRYQVLGADGGRVAFAPRVSAVLPAGSSRRGRGEGSAGVQVNLPLSATLGSRLVTHLNAGATFLPRAENNLGQSAATFGVNLGQSFIYKFHHRFHGLLEALYTSAESVTGPELKLREHSFVVNPGFRWAYNFENGLQIVPGISFPVNAAGAGRGSAGILIYLSLEHPFGKAAGR